MCRHQTLADVLADWRENGWARMMGRAPTVDDVIVPEPPYEGKSEIYQRMLRDAPTMKKADLARRLGVTPAASSQALARDPKLGRNGRIQTHGPYRPPTTVYKALQKDLALLGMRGRRTHDTRRTMITRSLNDGERSANTWSCSKSSPRTFGL